MNKLFAEIVGWYGAAAIVLAYALNSFGIVTAANLYYQLMNLTGAVGIVIISLTKKTYQPAAVNIIWAIVAAIGIAQVLFR